MICFYFAALNPKLCRRVVNLITVQFADLHSCYFVLGISVIFEAEEQQDLSPEAAVGQQLSNEFASLSTRAMPSSTATSPSLQTGVGTPVKNQTTAVINTIQPPPTHMLMTSQPGVSMVTSSVTLQASSHLSASSASPFMMQQHVANNNTGLYSSWHLTN